MLFGDYLRDWLELYVMPATLADRTKEMYCYAVRAVPDALAAVDLHQLTVMQLQAWLVSVGHEHPRKAQQCRVMLSKALRLAAKLRLCDLIIDRDTLPMPAHKARKAAVLSEEQITDYLSAVRASPLCPLLMLCLCGLRRGEALGARWEDIDGDVLRVERQRIRAAGRYECRRLKSDHARRALQLPAILVDVLRTWPRSVSGFLVDASPEWLYREHRRTLQRAGLDGVTVHGLRHSFATLAARRGVSMKVLQCALGHATIQLTADLYADHLDSASVVAAGLYS